jgi:hypothetical protein
MVLPRFTSPFRCMRSRFAKHLSHPCGTQMIVTPLIHLIKEGFFIRIHVHTGHKEIFGIYWHMASLGKKS